MACGCGRSAGGGASRPTRSVGELFSSSLFLHPTANGGMQNGSSVGIRTRCITRCFCTFRTDSYAQSVLHNKILPPELRRKFTKSALLVGHSLHKRGKIINLCFVQHVVHSFNKLRPSWQLDIQLPWILLHCLPLHRPPGPNY